MIISYGNSTTGYADAEIVIGPRGGITVASHNGNGRRVTRYALAVAARAMLAREPHPVVVTAAGDYLPVW